MARTEAAAERRGPAPGGRVWPPGLLLLAAALLGAGFAGWLGWRTHRDTTEVERLRFERAAAAHLGLIRDHLAQREALARAVAATFPAPAEIAPGALSRVDPRFLSFVPDITSFVWIPRVPPERAPEVLAALAEAGVERPALLGAGRRPLPAPDPARPIHPVLDIEPKTETNFLSLGLDLASLPLPREALERAERRREAAATAPLELVQLPGEKALVLYVPVLRRAEDGGAPLGYLGFSFRYARLIGRALEPAEVAGLGVEIADAEAAEAGPLFRAGPVPPGRGAAPPPLLREVSFGGRPWRVAYWPAEDPGALARSRALATGAFAALALFATLAVAWHLGRVGRRLSRALADGAAAEARLRVVVGELNHRSANILAVAQAIASQTLREGGEAGELRERLLARLQAMAGATGLLARSEWRGARLDEIVAGSGLPFADRVRVEGSGLLLAPGAAQSVVLLVHELWTNAAKHGALSVPGGRAVLACAARDGRFRLTWHEEGGPPGHLPERKGFGRTLLEALVPQQLGGQARLEGGAAGLCYLLEAPADRVLA